MAQKHPDPTSLYSNKLTWNTNITYNGHNAGQVYI